MSHRTANNNTWRRRCTCQLVVEPCWVMVEVNSPSIEAAVALFLLLRRRRRTLLVVHLSPCQSCSSVLHKNNQTHRRLLHRIALLRGITLGRAISRLRRGVMPAAKRQFPLFHPSPLTHKLTPEAVRNPTFYAVQGAWRGIDAKNRRKMGEFVAPPGRGRRGCFKPRPLLHCATPFVPPSGGSAGAGLRGAAAAPCHAGDRGAWL